MSDSESGGDADAGLGTDPLVDVRDVHKSYGDELVLEGLSFEMDRQDVQVLVGPSGSGKSTMLRCINRLTELDDGDIVLDGTSIFDMDVDELRREVGMVFQDGNLFAHLTALENVTLGLKRVLGMGPKKATEKAAWELEQVGLREQANSYPAELSGGQKQRVGIARALAMDPKLMLFDEPTSALDPELINEVLSVMRELADEGMTMLVVTHEMRFAREVGTDIMFLEDGRLVEHGPPEQLFEHPENDRTAEFLGRLTGLHGGQ